MSLISLLSIDKNENIPKSKNNEKVEPKNSDMELDFKDMLSLLLEADTSKEAVQISDNNGDVESKGFDFDKKSAKSVDISLDELLNFVSYLKSNGFKGNFPTDTKKIDNILQDQNAINDFKSVKNLDDLFSVAKKYDIKIVNMDIERLENSEFSDILTDKKLTPTLQKQEDTKTVSTSRIKQDIQKPHSIISNILKNEKPSFAKTKKSDIDTSVLKNILKNEDNNEIAKDIKIEKTKSSKIPSLKNSINKEVKKDTNARYEVAKEDTKIKIDNLFKSDAKEPIKTTQSRKTNSILNDKTPFLSSKIDKDIKKIDLKDTKKPSDIQKQDIPDSKESKTKSYIKVEANSQDSIAEKENAHKISDIKIEKKSAKKELKTDTQKEIKKDKKQIDTLAKKDQDYSFMGNKESVYVKKASQSNRQDISTKNTIDTFVNDLQDQIKNYKPPVMKVKMTLNPKNLGEVDVSMISRGNTLQINISSNSNTMAIFTQNQSEFKNSLVNMGFTNLNMNFNSQGNGSNKNKNEFQKNSKNISATNSNEDDTDSISISIPIYI